jgi:RNA polymerase sigma factor (sigma-70 family)
MELSERQLIELCISGNNLAQKKLYDAFSKKLYGICLRYAANEEEAQDILQDGFVKIFTKMNSFKFEGSFEGWMKRVMVHTAIEVYRKKMDTSDVKDIESSHLFSIPDEKTLEVEELLKIIQDLPNGYRMVFNLYAIEGYSHAEIAKKLNISEGTSKSQLARARAYLQKKILQNERPRLFSIQPLLILTRLIT